MSDDLNRIELPSPAKVNLMLSVHGKREDGFHALTSLVVALDFGDRLVIRRSEASVDCLRCSDPTVPTGEANLIMKAAAAFRVRLGQDAFFEFDLDKRIPMGAGLGGGSSNASVALRGMNALLDEPLNHAELLELAATLGSDCPFFIDSKPALMRGRGEIIEPLEPPTAAMLAGRRVALFRPGFGVETAWAYGQLASGAPASYESEVSAKERCQRFLHADGSINDLLFNSFEAPVGRKYLAIPTLLDELRALGLACLMSGSGSCCFVLLDDLTVSVSKIQEICRNAWGDSVFWVETSIC